MSSKRTYQQLVADFSAKQNVHFNAGDTEPGEMTRTTCVRLPSVYLHRRTPISRSRLHLRGRPLRTRYNTSRRRSGGVPFERRGFRKPKALTRLRVISTHFFMISVQRGEATSSTTTRAVQNDDDRRSEDRGCLRTIGRERHAVPVTSMRHERASQRNTSHKTNSRCWITQPPPPLLPHLPASSLSYTNVTSAGNGESMTKSHFQKTPRC